MFWPLRPASLSVNEKWPFLPIHTMFNRMNPIVFLDMDDVLVISQSFTSYQVITNFKTHDIDAWPELWDGLIFPEGKANLTILHDEFLPNYVLSSSWTNYLTKEQMQIIFRRTGLECIAENLHNQWTTPKGSQSSRLEEIEQWIAEHGVPNQQMLILDDYESGWSLNKSGLDKKGLVVLCDAYTGLVADKLVEAQKRLRKQDADRAK